MLILVMTLLVACIGTQESNGIISGLPVHIRARLHEALLRFDLDNDGTATVDEVAIGILSSSQRHHLRLRSMLPPATSYQRHEFGEEQCADPTLDALSFAECAVALARRQPRLTKEALGAPSGLQAAVRFEPMLRAFLRGCPEVVRMSPCWLEGWGSCSQCGTGVTVAAAAAGVAPSVDAPRTPGLTREATLVACDAFEVLENTDILGNNLGSHHSGIKSVDACCALCTSTGARCDGFSWVKSQSRCYLKCAGSVPQTNSSKATSGRRATPTPTPPIPPTPTPPPTPASGSAQILVSSDWHVEPWCTWRAFGDVLLAPHCVTRLADPCPHCCRQFRRFPSFPLRKLHTDQAEGGCSNKKEGKVCRFADANLTNMFSCRDQGGRVTPCNLLGNKDPPIEMEESHIASGAAQGAALHFFIGDTQAHGWTWLGNPSQDKAATIEKLMDRVFAEEVARFGSAANVVWTAGNNDGPHDSAFQKQDACTVAWAECLIRAGIVTDFAPAGDLVYSGSRNVTSLFRDTGFYAKPLPVLGSNAYAVVLNTNLGGSNKEQKAAMNTTLTWIHARHGNASSVYVLGHHPSVMGKGINGGYIPAQFRSMIKGVFAGHVHNAKATNPQTLFTQVPAVSQQAAVTGYWLATVSPTEPAVRVSESNDLFIYNNSPAHVPPNASHWRHKMK